MTLPEWCQTHSFKEFLEMMDDLDGPEQECVAMLKYDPPSGWKYGFPKPYSPKPDETLEDTLRRDGYPEKEIKSIKDEANTLRGVRFFGA